MTNTKHTPGPWEIANYENFIGFSIWAPGAGCIAERWYPSEHEDAPILANARLIAAAPAMLEALELLHRIALQTPAMNNPDDREIIDQAWAAIRLAVGETDQEQFRK